MSEDGAVRRMAMTAAASVTRRLYEFSPSWYIAAGLLLLAGEVHAVHQHQLPLAREIQPGRLHGLVVIAAGGMLSVIAYAGDDGSGRGSHTHL